MEEELRITLEDLEPLKQKYEEAVEKGEDIFEYRGGQVVTNFAKYLIEYLESNGK